MGSFVYSLQQIKTISGAKTSTFFQTFSLSLGLISPESKQKSKKRKKQQQKRNTIKKTSKFAHHKGDNSCKGVTENCWTVLFECLLIPLQVGHTRIHHSALVCQNKLHFFLCVRFIVALPTKATNIYNVQRRKSCCETTLIDIPVTFRQPCSGISGITWTTHQSAISHILPVLQQIWQYLVHLLTTMSSHVVEICHGTQKENKNISCLLVNGKDSS